jgi:hypothetical protein
MICNRGGAPRWIRRYGIKALTKHTIHYLEKDLKTAPVQQGNGQLMGSIISFIVLCVANAAVCKSAFFTGDWSETAIPLRETPLLVNGDDCVMVYNRRQRERWGQLAALIGMKPSIGKCYDSNEWLQINSTAFFRRASGFERCPYINFGLLGPNKVRGNSRRTFTELSATAREFLAGHDESKHDSLMSLFIRSHMREGGLLREVPEGLSWWLPVHLGGLGLPWTRGLSKTTLPDLSLLEASVSGKQRQLATYIWDSYQTTSPVRPFPGTDDDLAPWISAGLVRDKRYEIAIPHREWQNSLESDEAVALSAERFGRKVVADVGIGPYSSALWEQALSLPTETEALWDDPDVCLDRKPDPLRRRVWKKVVKHWQRNWDRSRSHKQVAPLGALLSVEPHVHTFPGGLSATLNSVRAVPRGVFGRLSALLDRVSGEGSVVQMKPLLAELPPVRRFLPALLA